MAAAAASTIVDSVALIVEDHVEVRRALRDRILASFSGFRFFEAGNVDDALRIVQDKHVDLALMDIRLPGKDGVDGTRMLLERSPRTRVIMVSLFDDTSHRKAAREAGALAFVSKRSISKELIPAIWRLVACEA
jgi:DNA-binding NarL/FixJ family response regulator